MSHLPGLCWALQQEDCAVLGCEQLSGSRPAGAPLQPPVCHQLHCFPLPIPPLQLRPLYFALS